MQLKRKGPGVIDSSQPGADSAAGGVPMAAPRPGQTLAHGLALGRTGDMAPIRQITRELAPWFVQHTDAMDVPLAMHLKRVGFDPASGTVAHPHALPPEVIHGCASESCSPATTHAAAAASIA